MMLYQRDYKTMRYNEVEFTVTTGDSGENCLYQECRNYWYLTYGKKYWLLVNWDYENDASVSFTTLDLNGVRTMLSAVTVATAAALALY